MAANPDRRIKISWATSRYILGRDDGIRIRFEVLSAAEMAERIFAYRMLPLNPTTGEKVGHFSHVCSPADVAEFPEDEPLDGHRPEWFRLNFVDVLVRSLDEAADFITKVRADVRRLKHTYDVADTLQPANEENLGADEPEPSSSDSSASETSSDSSSESSAGPVQSLTSSATLFRNVGQNGVSWEVGEDGRHVILQAGQSSKMLLAQGFDFSDLPENATLVGIEAVLTTQYPDDADGSSSASSQPAQEGPHISIFQLYDPERGLVGENKDLEEPEVLQGPSPSDVIRGGEFDMWRTELTASTARRGDFGAGIMMDLLEPEQATAVVVELAITLFYR